METLIPWKIIYDRVRTLNGLKFWGHDVLANDRERVRDHMPNSYFISRDKSFVMSVCVWDKFANWPSLFGSHFLFSPLGAKVKVLTRHFVSR
jgi:hypothetical protein